MSRIKILQLITTTIGGAGEHVLLLSKGLDPSVFDVCVAFAPGMPLDSAFEQAGLRVVHIPMDRRGSLFRAFMGVLKLLRLLRRERFDIVHTHTSVAGAIGRVAASVTGVPVRLHMLHAYAGHEHQGRTKRRLLTAVEVALDRLTTFYIAGSDAIARKGVEKGIFPVSKVRRIYYALDLRRFDSSTGDAAGIRDTLGVADGDCLVVLAGRLEQQKGIEFLIEAAGRLAAAGVRATYAIVGDGPLRRALEAQRDALSPRPNVQFVGWQKDIAGYMRAADIVAVPSRWEAFGIVNLEAMAARKPIVASRVEGIPEVVEEGRCGILIDVGDVSALSDALSRLIVDPSLRQAMGAAGRSRVESAFSAASMVEAHVELYRHLLGSSRRAALKTDR